MLFLILAEGGGGGHHYAQKTMKFPLHFYMQKQSTFRYVIMYKKTHTLRHIFICKKQWSNHRRSRFSVWLVNNRTLLLSLTSTVGGQDIYFIKTISDVLLFRVNFSSKQRRSHSEYIRVR